MVRMDERDAIRSSSQTSFENRRANIPGFSQVNV
jgi:hypothetical protein